MPLVLLLASCADDERGIWLRGVGHLAAPDRAPSERWDRSTLRVPIERVDVAHVAAADCEDWDAGGEESAWRRLDDPPDRIDLVYLEQEDAFLGDADLEPGVVTAIRLVPAERPVTYVGPYGMQVPVTLPRQDAFLATGCVPVGKEDASEVIARIDLSRLATFTDVLTLTPAMDLVGEAH